MTTATGRAAVRVRAGPRLRVPSSSCTPGRSRRSTAGPPPTSPTSAAGSPGARGAPRPWREEFDDVEVVATTVAEQASDAVLDAAGSRSSPSSGGTRPPPGTAGSGSVRRRAPCCTVPRRRSRSSARPPHLEPPGPRAARGDRRSRSDDEHPTRLGARPHHRARPHRVPRAAHRPVRGSRRVLHRRRADGAAGELRAARRRCAVPHLPAQLDLPAPERQARLLRGRRARRPHRVRVERAGARHCRVRRRRACAPP